MDDNLDYTIQLDTVSSGYDRKTFWTHARAGIVPPATAVITTSKTQQGGSDIFHTIHEFRSDDLGQTWRGPVAQESLSRRPFGEGIQAAPCDAMPAWHAASGKLLMTGQTALYEGAHLTQGPYHRRTFYSVYDPGSSAWTPWCAMEMPDSEKFFNCGAGSTQRVDLPNGDILLPVYFTGADQPLRTKGRLYKATVVRCAFDGETLSVVEHGDELEIATPRGLCEPSLAPFGSRFFLTLRNDEKGYVTSGPDGLHFDEPREWAFDDGEALGNYNTQQHWISHSDGLFLVYTRRGAENDHVFRHRAPLFMARVDPDRLCVIRASEKVVVPERGARLGNFGTVNVTPEESWVVVSEWMQTRGPNPYDYTIPESYGSDNSIFVSRIRWNRPNGLV